MNTPTYVIPFDLTLKVFFLAQLLFSSPNGSQAGNKDEGLIFLLTDSQITNERFLIYINDLLASGNIPDLFAVDEVDAIVSQPI